MQSVRGRWALKRGLTAGRTVNSGLKTLAVLWSLNDAERTSLDKVQRHTHCTTTLLQSAHHVYD